MEPEITFERVGYAGRFLQFVEKGFRDRTGTEKLYEFIRREGRRRAVVVIPFCRKSGRFVLIRQFRVPAGKRIIEFPAGLIDDGETPEQAACREMAEETGYRGRVVSLSSPTPTSPGLTDEEVHFAFFDVDESVSPVPAPEASEWIESFQVGESEWTALKKEETQIQSWVSLALDLCFSFHALFLEKKV